MVKRVYVRISDEAFLRLVSLACEQDDKSPLSDVRYLASAIIEGALEVRQQATTREAVQRARAVVANGMNGRAQ
jgi:hypothetical protein